MTDEEGWGFETRAIHGGQPPDAVTGAVVPPISLATTFAQDGVARPRSQGQTWQRTIWLWPVPPPGDITVVCTWPDRQIAETRSVVPAAPLIRACADAAALWS